MKTLIALLIIIFIFEESNFAQPTVNSIKKNFDLAYQLDTQGKDREAITYYEKVIKLLKNIDPNDFDVIDKIPYVVYLNIASCFERLNNYQSALKNFSIAYSQGKTIFLLQKIIKNQLRIDYQKKGWMPVLYNQYQITSDGDLYFYNPSKLTHNHGIAKVWILKVNTGLKDLDYNEFDKTTDEGLEDLLTMKFPSSMESWGYDCNLSKSCIFKMVQYDAEGNLTYNKTFSDNTWTEVYENTIGDGLLKAFCK